MTPKRTLWTLGILVAAQALIACAETGGVSAKLTEPSGSDVSEMKPYVCQTEDGTEEGPGIVGGKRLKRKSPLASSIVYLRMLVDIKKPEGEGIGCTGTLIADNIVVTAAHCVFEGDATNRAERAMVFLTTDPFCTAVQGRREDVRAVDAVKIHPEYDGTEGKLNYDLALIRLSKPVSADFRPMPVVTSFDKLDPSISVFLAGYGITTDYGVEDKTAPLLRFSKVKPTAPATVGAITNDSESARLSFDQTGGGACRGDSGGPAVVKQNGKLKILGVASQVTGHKGEESNCKAYVLHTSLSFYNEWLKTTFTELTKDKTPKVKNPFLTP